MVTKDESRKYLGDVAPEQCFWVNNGPIIKNLEELANALPQLSDDSFKHHVSKEKNDFSKWINEIIGDRLLANELLSSRNRESLIKKMNSRLSALKKKAG